MVVAEVAAEDECELAAAAAASEQVCIESANTLFLTFP